MTINWEKQEAGWHTSEIGGISRETNGWFFFPKDKNHVRFGPFKTLALAKIGADSVSSKNRVEK